MNNSFHSDNFIFPINAASQVLTLSNIPSQSPAASYSRPSRKMYQMGCIRVIFCVHPIGKYLPGNHELDKLRRRKAVLTKELA